jgi:hypothetical protein
MAGDRARRGSPAEHNADTLSAREASADVYRVLAVFVVVIGHWLVSTVTLHVRHLSPRCRAWFAREKPGSNGREARA